MIYVDPETGAARAVYVDVESEYPSLAELLADHGLTEEDLEDVHHG